MLKTTSTGTILIDQSDLDIKSRNGNELRSTCPMCRESREHPNDPSLAIDVTTGAGMCHHCGRHVLVKDFTKTLQDKYPPRVTTPCTEEKDFMEGVTELDERCRQFLALRNIDPEVVSKAHVGTKDFYGIPYLAFPFVENGKAVNVQYKRADGKKKEFRFTPGGKMIPWNIDCINAEKVNGPLYITEGMMDAIALMQSGFHNVVSVPNGAGSKMEVFDSYKKLITKKFTHIVFAGDNDEVGKGLRDKVKKYFEGTDVSTVTWKWRDSVGKDANDILCCKGTEAVAGCIRSATFDEENLYSTSRCKDSALWNLFENGLPESKGIGIKEIDELVRMLPGYTYVLTGYPGAGKSSLVNFVTMSLLHLYGWRTLFYSPEKMPLEYHMRELISIVSGKMFDKRLMDISDMISADEYLSGNVMHIDDCVTNLDKILSIASKAIRRHDIKVFVIDPFLYLNIDNLCGKSESTRISEMLIKIHQFAKINNVAVIIVAHPRKPNLMAERPGISEELYEISGSSGFSDTCDIGIVIRRPDMKENTIEISCCKCRYDFLGKIGKTRLTYFPFCGRYSAENPDKYTKAHLFRSWTYDDILYGRENVSDYKSDAPF